MIRQRIQLSAGISLLLLLLLLATDVAAAQSTIEKAQGIPVNDPLIISKCAGCHGAEGQGKVGPALKGTSLTDAQITDVLTKGDDTKKAPHKKAVSGLSADDAKAVAMFVKSLK